MKALGPTWEGFKSGEGQSKAAKHLRRASLDRYAETAGHRPATTETTTASADEPSTAMTVAPAASTWTARPALPAAAGTPDWHHAAA